MTQILVLLYLGSFVIQGVFSICENNSEKIQLDLIHFNDFHARFEETTMESSICHSDDNECLGGFPRLYHVISELKKEKPESLLLNAGDSLQGTYWHAIFKWNVLGEFMNLLPHDAHAIGNHDFDDGPVGLSGYISSLNAPVLAANMDASFEPILEGLYQPHVIVERKGKKIGIIGLITTDTELFSHVGNVKFTDPRVALKREIRDLKEQGVDIIIVLSHCGHETDALLAREFGKDIAIIVGGHSHRSDRSQHLQPVAIETDDEDKQKVLLVSASAFGTYVGNLTIYLNCEGNYIDHDGNMIYLNRSIPEDLGVKAMLAPYAELVHIAEQTPVGESMTMMPHEECSRGECALGNLMTDALNELAKNAVKTNLDYVSFAQQDYLPVSLPQGVITHGVLVELLPYYDQIETFNMKGNRIKDALEWGVRDAEFYEDFKIPSLLQVSGLKVAYNITNPKGKRVTSVTVGADNQPLKHKQVYQVTAPGFLADGGNGYTMFKNYKKNMRVIGHDQDVLKEYIERQSPLNIVREERITMYY